MVNLKIIFFFNIAEIKKSSIYRYPVRAAIPDKAPVCPEK